MKKLHKKDFDFRLHMDLPITHSGHTYQTWVFSVEEDNFCVMASLELVNVPNQCNHKIFVAKIKPYLPFGRLVIGVALAKAQRWIWHRLISKNLNQE